MSRHTANIHWSRDGDAFAKGKYSRAHLWHFDGGLNVPASASPHIVKPPYSDPHGVDPEEAFVAALSSCHMLWFLELAAKAGFIVDLYDDQAEGLMEGDIGRGAMITEVVLKPVVHFSGPRVPDDEAVANLHHESHERCFLARSVKSRVIVRPPAPAAP